MAHGHYTSDSQPKFPSEPHVTYGGSLITRNVLVKKKLDSVVKYVWNRVQDFFEVSKNCSVVVACRVSPLQKSQLVRALELVRARVSFGSEEVQGVFGFVGV